MDQDRERMGVCTAVHLVSGGTRRPQGQGLWAIHLVVFGAVCRVRLQAYNMTFDQWVVALGHTNIVSSATHEKTRLPRRWCREKTPAPACTCTCIARIARSIQHNGIQHYIALHEHNVVLQHPSCMTMHHEKHCWWQLCKLTYMHSPPAQHTLCISVMRKCGLLTYDTRASRTGSQCWLH